MGTAAIVTLALLLAIILKGLVESFFVPLTAHRALRDLLGPPKTETYLRSWQFLVFLVLLGRFYWGAYRFNQEQPPAQNFVDGLLNMTGTVILFLGFYVTAVNVWSLDIFYVMIFATDVFDFVWFLIVLVRLAIRLGVHSPLLKPATLFVLWDVLTIVAYIVLYVAFSTEFLSGTKFWLQWATLGFLAGISLIDFLVLRDFYFRPEQWRAEPA
jgi:hypothetical protein